MDQGCPSSNLLLLALGVIRSPLNPILDVDPIIIRLTTNDEGFAETKKIKINIKYNINAVTARRDFSFQNEYILAFRREKSKTGQHSRVIGLGYT